MVCVELVKSSRGESATPVELEFSGEGLWVSVGASELCDVDCHLFRPDDALKVAVFNGFIFARIDCRFYFGFGQLVFSMNRGVKVTLTLRQELPQFSRGVLYHYFDAFAEHYMCPQYSSLRKNIIESSSALLELSESHSQMMAEIARQISSHLHCIHLKVGQEIPILFQLALAAFCDFCFEGPFLGHLSDEEVTEVVVNGSTEVWIERRGLWEKAHFPFHDWYGFESWLLFQSSFSNSDLYGSGCFSDFVLRSGARVHVCRSPVARSDGYVSMRRHRMKGWDLQELTDSGFLSDTQRDCLLSALQRRLNILVVGPTSSGKTTLLGALARHCRSGERILVLEDTPELRVEHDHVVYMQTVMGQEGGAESVALSDLVRNALRMRPDRIVVGECRGDEVFALLNALQTGHSGSMCTLHAQSAQQGIVRLRALLQRAEPSISDSSANSLIALGLNIVVCVSREATGERRIAEIRDVQSLLHGA